MKKIRYLDLFAGCGGLSEGFESTKKYEIVSAVEWEKVPLNTLCNRLKFKYNVNNAEDICLNFDIQRTDELFNGWNDEKYGSSLGLKNILGQKKVEFIIGGPPCQAYSIAGRIRDKNGMKDDYRNYLFESYIRVVSLVKPDLIVFENVPGMLSAKPNGVNIVDRIQKEFNKNGYEILDNLNDALIDVSDYGVPQVRKRVIIIGIKKGLFNNNQKILQSFYKNYLPKYKKTKRSVRDAIGDLPKLIPCVSGDKVFYHGANSIYSDHNPRFHNIRDMKIFSKLAFDIDSGANIYATADSIKELYYKETGKKSNIHKYHVLLWDQPSTTIVSHLHKDGLRHIHPDYEQARTITIREAARLQSFPDDFEFLGNQGDKYKMIGNAVPPLFANSLANALYDFYNDNFI